MTPELEKHFGEHAMSCHGWTERERCVEMAALIMDHRPTLVVEIGVYGGRTLIPQALALRELGGGMICGIDPWRTEAALEGENEANREWWRRLDMEDFHRQTMNHIWRLELDRWCSIIRSPSQYVSRIYGDGTIDVINIDGNHSEVASCRDAELWLPKVRQGGFIWTDDANWPSTQKMLEILDKACERVKDGGNYRLYQKK